ncbi:MAG: YtxH domain-containing protein [bacterium]
MSYAGPVRTRGASPVSPGKTIVPFSGHETDWRQIAVFGAGLALGLAVGAGVALLTAPQAGDETRAYLRRRAGRTSRAVGRRGRDAWADLRDELSGMTRAIRRRKVRRAAAQDLERESAAD